MGQQHQFTGEVARSGGIRKLSLGAIISLSNLNGRISGMEPEEKGMFLKTLTLKESVCQHRGCRIEMQHLGSDSRKDNQ